MILHIEQKLAEIRGRGDELDKLEALVGKSSVTIAEHILQRRKELHKELDKVQDTLKEEVRI